MMRGGLAVMVPGGSNGGHKRMKSWERAVRDAALDACPVTLQERPVVVSIQFRMPRPRGHTNERTGQLRPKAPQRPSVKPDVDKLARCTLDALTGVAFDDDSRIVELVLFKTYALPGEEGARIVVKEWRP
jgi:crossover junction endodeoxyribonuclease RusA